MLTLPRSNLKKQGVLQKVAEKFKKGIDYSEDEVNEIIKSAGADDHVLFRRELVDYGYLSRDLEGKVYRLEKYVLSKEDIDRILKG